MKYERLVTKFGSAYIVWMMIATRLGGLIGGAAVVYYVRLATDLSGALQYHFSISAAVVVLLAITTTVILALWETRNLREVMRRLHLGHSFPKEMGRKAGREAVVFSVHHHLREAVVVPLCCLPPVYVYLTWAADASVTVLAHITIATFMGIGCALSLTYFIIERLMHPVVQHLIDYGVVIDYETIPVGRLQNRLLFCFTLIIVITAVMIATLANQKVADLVNHPRRLDQVVASLKFQTIAISTCAVLMALTLSALLARSVTTRVQDMVRAMRRVEAGHLDERIVAISTDELGMVGRSFNKMVSRLEQHEYVIRELNTNLEAKVKGRTRELAVSKQELQRSYERLKEHDRLKTEFFSNISHELRTPLTLILAPVENMLEDRSGNLPTEHRNALAVVRRNTLRLLNLINDLLDFAKLEANKSTILATPTDVNDLIDELVSSASVLAHERGLVLTFDRDPLIPALMLDRAKIEKVVINLLSNALKFTRSGGRVSVETSTADGDLVIAVNDNGIGISRANQERIYERFVQIDGSTSRQYEGTGLGLPLVKQLVEQHGGAIHLESELGKGARFTVTIPMDLPDGEAVIPLASVAACNYSQLLTTEFDHADAVIVPRRPDAAKLLIVDDSPDIVAVLKTVLAHDYDIIEAADGETGFRLAVEHQPDVVISDVMMPNMDGNEFCMRIKTDPKTERIGFILLTAKAEPAMRIEGLEQGADDYLIKPFNPQELRARVRSLVKVRSLDRQLQARNDELESTLVELRRTQDHLVNTEKMSSLGQLAAGIAHEINNAINAVYNGILPLREQVKDIEELVAPILHHTSDNGPDGRTPHADLPAGDIRDAFALIDELAATVQCGAKRTAEIVTDLKKFAHPGQETHRSYDIHEALEVALTLLSNKIRNNVRIHRNYCDNGHIICSGTQLTQVFLNLLDNALYAVPADGEVRIDTVRTSADFEIRICDNGAGIPESIRNQIFDPFFTTKEIGTGTGMGLSISYGIVKGHRGTIDVHSPPPDAECGTEFIITLPLQDGNPQLSPADQSSDRQRQSECVT